MKTLNLIIVSVCAIVVAVVGFYLWRKRTVNASGKEQVQLIVNGKIDWVKAFSNAHYAASLLKDFNSAQIDWNNPFNYMPMKAVGYQLTDSVFAVVGSYKDQFGAPIGCIGIYAGKVIDNPITANNFWYGQFDNYPAASNPKLIQTLMGSLDRLKDK